MTPENYDILKTEFKNILLETDRLRIRRFKDADEDGFFALFRDPHTMAADGDTPMTEKNEEFYRRMNMVRSGRLLFLCVCDKTTDEFIGFILLNSFPEERETAVTLGCSLLPERQGMGIGQEAVSAVISALKERTAVKTVLADARTDNAPSLNLIRRLGFSPLGTDGEKAHFALEFG